METVADQMLYSVKLADTVYESSGSVHDSLEPIELVLLILETTKLLTTAFAVSVGRATCRTKCLTK